MASLLTAKIYWIAKDIFKRFIPESHIMPKPNETTIPNNEFYMMNF